MNNVPGVCGTGGIRRTLAGFVALLILQTATAFGAGMCLASATLHRCKKSLIASRVRACVRVCVCLYVCISLAVNLSFCYFLYSKKGLT